MQATKLWTMEKFRKFLYFTIQGHFLYLMQNNQYYFKCKIK